MATLKYTAVIACSLIIGGLATATISRIIAPSAQAESQAAERKVLYWYDPMKPDVRFDKPGKSPFMDMDLVAKYADEAGIRNRAASVSTLLRCTIWGCARRKSARAASTMARPFPRTSATTSTSL